MTSKNNNMVPVAMMALGFLLIVLAWNGAANFDTVQQQFPYLISGGLSGLGLIAGGIAVMLVQEQRRSSAMIERKLDQIVQALGASDTSATAILGTAHLTERQRRALDRASVN